MIILHNQHDKDSRDFVDKYGDNNQIIEYPECVEKYVYISAFPSVVIDVPAYYQPSQELTFQVPIEDSTSGDTTSSTIIIPEYNISDHIEIRRFSTDPCDIDAFWQDIQDYIKTVNDRAITNPPKDGVEYKDS